MADHASTDLRVKSQRSDAADILRLAAFHALDAQSSTVVYILVRRALSHVKIAERIARGEL